MSKNMGKFIEKDNIAEPKILQSQKWQPVKFLRKPDVDGVELTNKHLEDEVSF